MKFDAFTELVKSGDYVILDTETTGLDDGQICQIAIIDSMGNTLINTLVKPTHPIPEGATAVHGITDDMVSDAPDWKTITPQIESIINGRLVVVYNSAYDYKMLHNSAKAAGFDHWHDESVGACAMLAYAEFWGDWNDYRKSYRWQSLTNAAEQQGIEIANAHDALGDCLMTLAVIKAMVKESTNDR